MILANPMAGPVTPTPPGDGPYEFHQKLPGLRAGARSRARAGRTVKDESDRFGLPSFKMLGASWATYRTLVERLGEEPSWDTVDELAEQLAALRPLTLTTATDGNHGRAVAHMAALLGFDARIYVPDDMVPARIEAIEGEGASVVVVDGTYDEAVPPPQRRATWSSPTPARATAPAGSSRATPRCSGSWATATSTPSSSPSVSARWPPRWSPRSAPARPCSWRCRRRVRRAWSTPSQRGEVSTLPDTPRTIMSGISCGTPSPTAWPIVSRGRRLGRHRRRRPGQGGDAGAGGRGHRVR